MYGQGAELCDSSWGTDYCRAHLIGALPEGQSRRRIGVLSSPEKDGPERDYLEQG